MAKKGRNIAAKKKPRETRRISGAKSFGRFAAGLRVSARGSLAAQRRCARHGDVFGAAFYGIAAQIYGTIAAEAQMECDR